MGEARVGWTEANGVVAHDSFAAIWSVAPLLGLTRAKRSGGRSDSLLAVSKFAHAWVPSRRCRSQKSPRPNPRPSHLPLGALDRRFPPPLWGLCPDLSRLTLLAEASTCARAAVPSCGGGSLHALGSRRGIFVTALRPAATPVGLTGAKRKHGGIEVSAHSGARVLWRIAQNRRGFGRPTRMFSPIIPLFWSLRAFRIRRPGCHRTHGFFPG